MMVSKLPFSYQIRRSQRVTNARIVVKPGEVEIVAPWQIPEQQLHDFVLAKRLWIARALNKMAASSAKHSEFVPAEFKTGATLAYLGERYPITLIASKLKRIKVEFNQGFEIHIPETLPVEAQQQSIADALIRWMKRQTRQLVIDCVNHYATQKQLIPRSITIKTQRSRWGSCGIYNDININWLLIMAPKPVLEYVVVHELCHIKIKNHSQQFWCLVAEHLPDYKTRRRWLKQEGRSLMLAFSN